MSNKFVVIGGAGAMGKITVTDLYHTSKSTDEIVVADYDLNKAQALIESFPKSKDRPKMSAVKVNVRNIEDSAKTLKAVFILIVSEDSPISPSVGDSRIESCVIGKVCI